MKPGRESRPVVTRAAQDLAGGASITSIISRPGGGSRVSARPVATARVDRLDSAHDICFRLWDRTAMLNPMTTVRIVVGDVWPPVFLPDIRADLSYAIDTWRGDRADAWIDALQRAGAKNVVLL